MNSSQLLYKISNLQYSIRIKEVEYTRAVSAADQLNIDLTKAALKLLKEDLDASVKAFNTIPAPDSNKSYKEPKRTGWWQNLFNFKAATNKK